jgi:hypothetical protein
LDVYLTGWLRCRIGHLLAQRRPLQERVECRTQCLPPGRQRVLHLGRDLVVNDASHDRVRFHLAKLLDEHLLRNGRDRAFEIREPLYLAPEQVKEDHELPPPLQHLECLLNASRC